MSTYVVAGGAGFIGSHICERLLNEGNKVVCVDNLITGAESNIEPFYKNNNFIFLRHDVISGIPKIEGEVAGIFHLASPASPNEKSHRSYIAHPIETLMVNSLGTYNILEFSVVKRAPVVYASSSEVYGDPSVSPQQEDYFGNVNPNGPRSVYDEGKRFGEAICASYNRSFKADARIIRIFNTYGDRMQKDDGRVVSNFINQALRGEDITIYGDGKQTRSFCYVDDLVEGLIAAVEAKDVVDKVMNLGNPEEYTIVELAQKILKLTNSKSKIVHEGLPIDDPRKRRPDITRAKNTLGFEPKVPIAQGLQKTIEYFRGV